MLSEAENLILSILVTAHATNGAFFFALDSYDLVKHTLLLAQWEIYMGHFQNK
jgi:hypothetical protein